MTIWLLQLAGYAISLLILWPTGNAFVRLLLDLAGTPAVPSSEVPATDEQKAATVRAGRYIGALERLLIVIGVLARSWEVIAAVIALKSVTRYKELDKQISAEYFLIGSLSSLVWSLLVALALLWYDSTMGWNIAAWIASKVVG